MQQIIFATGIECSCPTVAGGRRRDQLKDTKHYERWRDDLRLARELGASLLRYGPPYFRMHRGPEQYDWEWTDTVLPVMRDLGITPMIDLCHYGVPDWVGNFQNDEWPELFAAYAEAFARRYPWVCYFTPVNEILVCATLSALEGLWNERLRSGAAWCRSLMNQCKANQMAIERILRVTPEAVFFQSEPTEVTLARSPNVQRQVNFANQRRFITYDFLYGHEVDGSVLMYLLDNGVKRADYEWLISHGRQTARHCVMGMDYYAHNEKVMEQDGSVQILPGALGWHTIAADYYERYHRPMMLTETNTIGTTEGTRPAWLWKMWYNVAQLRDQGVPVIGFTWYSLQDQVDWDTLLLEENGHVVPVGLVTLDRQVRDVGEAFKALASAWGSQPLLQEFAIGSMRGA